MVKYAVLDSVLLYIVIVSANTMVSLYSICVNSSIKLILYIGINMQFTITLDTDNTLIDNLNAIEDALRSNSVLTQSDNLVAITDNPIHPDSITLREDVVISAVGDQISVVNPSASVDVVSKES